MFSKLGKAGELQSEADCVWRNPVIIPGSFLPVRKREKGRTPGVDLLLLVMLLPIRGMLLHEGRFSWNDFFILEFAIAFENVTRTFIHCIILSFNIPEINNYSELLYNIFFYRYFHTVYTTPLGYSIHFLLLCKTLLKLIKIIMHYKFKNNMDI